MPFLYFLNLNNKAKQINNFNIVKHNSIKIFILLIYNNKEKSFITFYIIFKK